MENVSAVSSLKDGALNLNTWLLFIQYACCFGVEITMNNASALYFSHKFALSTEKAAMAASIFGWMNIFARGCGGYISDKMNACLGKISNVDHNSCFNFHSQLIYHFFLQACEADYFGNHLC